MKGSKLLETSLMKEPNREKAANFLGQLIFLKHSVADKFRDSGRFFFPVICNLNRPTFENI